MDEGKEEMDNEGEEMDTNRNREEMDNKEKYMDEEE